MSSSKKPTYKNINLRAFSISKVGITSQRSNTLETLINILDQSRTAESRAMSLNHEDENGEKDLITYYETVDHPESVFFMMMRIAPGEDNQPIPKELMNKKVFTLEDVNKYANKNEDATRVIPINHFYYLLDDDFLVTNLPCNNTGKNIQTYLSWLISKELLELTPVIVSSEGMRLNQIKSVTVEDTTIHNSLLKNDDKNEKLQYVTKGKTISLYGSVLKAIQGIIKDTNDLSEIDLSEFISAKLLIQFKKPKDVTEEEYQKKLGALLKPVADLDNYSFKDKNNKTIAQGKEILNRKSVDIEIAETGKLSEPNLQQEMRKFLTELHEV